MDSLLNDGPQASTGPMLDETEIETLLTNVAEHTLPETVRELVDEYQSLKDARPPFMWKWVHQLAPQNTLPCVDTEYTDTVPIDKTLLILFITLLDDVLEKHQDRTTFIVLSRIPFEDVADANRRDGADDDYVGLGRRVWETIQRRLESSPKYAEFEQLFRHDLKQAINAIEYSNIAIQRPDLATMGDLERYESHNMVLFAYSDVDFMHSSVDVRDEFATLREVIWTAQLMARIGNWVSTWERELQEGDFSAGPIVYALESDIISHTELTEAEATDDAELRAELIERIKAQDVDTEFLRRWKQHYSQLQAYNTELSAFDLEPFIDGTAEVLRYHLASTGLK